jgi:hypothetical protein
MSVGARTVAVWAAQIVKKGQRRWVGFDKKVIALDGRGLSVREIQGHLGEIYGTDVSPDLISKITDAVLQDAKAWQSRPLEGVYAIVYLDALVVKIRDGQTVRNHACYLAIGVNLDGEREVLGMWFQRTEGGWSGRREAPGPRGCVSPTGLVSSRRHIDPCMRSPAHGSPTFLTAGIQLPRRRGVGRGATMVPLRSIRPMRCVWWATTHQP